MVLGYAGENEPAGETGAALLLDRLSVLAGV